MFNKMLGKWVESFYGPNGVGAPFGTKPDVDLNFAVATQIILWALPLGLLWVSSLLWSVARSLLA